MRSCKQCTWLILARTHLGTVAVPVTLVPLTENCRTKLTLVVEVAAGTGETLQEGLTGWLAAAACVLGLMKYMQVNTTCHMTINPEVHSSLKAQFAKLKCLATGLLSAMEAWNQPSSMVILHLHVKHGEGTCQD